MKEAQAREADILALATIGDSKITKIAAHTIFVPPCAEEISPILNMIPLQMLAYHIAVWRGCDVDQPRNLAKSVTVE